MMYTYRFINNYDPLGSTEICAETQEEANDLYIDFCKENDIKYSFYIIELVYNQDDAKEYGVKYGFQQ